MADNWMLDFEIAQASLDGGCRMRKSGLEWYLMVWRYWDIQLQIWWGAR